MRKPLLFTLLFVSLFLTGYSQSNYQAVTYAGNPEGNAGFMNRADTNAMFNSPTAVAVDTAGNIYVADTYNNAIREILVTNDSVITLAGDTAGYSKGSDSTVGYVNGLGSVARFNYPLGICVDKGGNHVYVADTYNNVIREIWVVKGNTAKDSVSTIAGNDTLGYVNGIANHAEFNRPIGVALDTVGNLFVTDEGNNVVREVAIVSGSTVSTFAGPQPNDTTIVSGYVNGRTDTAEFKGLYGITFDKSNTMYVTEYKNNSVRMIQNGIVSTIAGFDSITYILPPDTLGDTVTVYTPTGYINGLNIGAQFDNPTGITVDDSGNVYVADEFNYVIRKINTKEGIVSTFAGDTNTSTNTFGFVNGPVVNARFSDPMGIALDHYGRFYIADNANNVIRRLYVSAPLGIAAIKPNKISVAAYPNPCTDKLTIASAPKGTAELVDITGRTVWQDEQFKAPYTISTGDISPGVYFLKVSSETQTAVEKIIVQH